MSFIHDDFLLQSPTARRLYHDWARDLPIIDYHCHLPPADIAQDRRFDQLHAIWLEGDHYKWRAMRANGVEEALCTGDADPYDKFLAWARTMPYTVRNPLYHWTHLELKRYFDIDTLLNEETAPAIWAEANERLADPAYSVQGLLRRFKVEVVCTTDDPADDLAHHQQLANGTAPTAVYPTFRPDALFQIADPAAFNAYVDRLGQTADMKVDSLTTLMEALRKRHDFFHSLGGRLSDHGLNQAFCTVLPEAELATIYGRARAGETVSPNEANAFAHYILEQTARWDAEKGWVKQLHLGALRRVNSRMTRLLGPDTGYDSIGDWPQAEALGKFMDRLDADEALPRMILYNLNPADNYVMATMTGNFQDGRIPGKIQWGSGWWFLDQLDGMTWQLNTLSSLGLLSRFVGMLTDSRSFMSFPRHEYFRRLLCNLVGRDVEQGLVPNDDTILEPLIRGVCHDNAAAYFRFGS